MKCQICETQTIKKTWKHCPECGVKIEADKINNKGYSLEHIRQGWIHKDLENRTDKFKVIEHIGTDPFKRNVDRIRPILGEYIGIHFSNLKILSTLSIQPRYLIELCEILRIEGKQATDYGLKALKLSSIIETYSKTEYFWKIIPKIRRNTEESWKKICQAVIEFESIQEEQGSITIQIVEGQMAYLRKKESLNFIEKSLLEGQFEAVLDKKVIGRESTKAGRQYITLKVYPKKEKIEHKVSILDRSEYERLLDDVVEYISCNKPSGRKILPEVVHRAGDQTEAYFILKASEGHRILEKHSGVITGGKIAERLKLEGEKQTIGYISEMFKRERVSIITDVSFNEEGIVLKMVESAYSSGAENANIKMDVYIAGLIEGALNQATKQRWEVKEMKCVAMGYQHCEFECKRISSMGNTERL